MDEFVSEIVKPSWWVGVVVVGFIINLASAYAKPALDRAIGHFWFSSKQAAEKKKALIEAEVLALIANPQRVLELKLDVLTDGVRGVVAC